MNERGLRIFYEVSETLNMTKAGNSLFISQPAISQTIRELEDELEVKLFDRIGHKLFLTNEGNVFLNYTRRILNLYDDLSKIIEERSDLKGGKLRIGASTTIGIYLLPDIIGKFNKLNHEVNVSISIENTKIITEMILENKIDFAFVEGPIYSDEIVETDFCEDELVFITPPTHPWTKMSEVDIGEIEKVKIIMRERGSGTREVLENVFKENNVDYKIKFELGNTEAIKKAVEAGLGVSCISRRCTERELQDGKIALVKLKGLKIARKFYLIYHKDKHLTKLFDKFIQFCRKQVA